MKNEIDFYLYFYRYLQKTRYKKNQKKADKATNVISVPKKGKSPVAVSAVSTTMVTNSSKTAHASNCNVGGVPFIIPKIEQPDEELSLKTLSTPSTVERKKIKTHPSIGNVCV